MTFLILAACFVLFVVGALSILAIFVARTTDSDIPLADLHDNDVLPPPKRGMAAIMGKWPGDETEEEIAEALEELS